ncbi:P-loop containing nucleoside triphosphate hydrolase protein [Zopfia rhizophila CBS 207.26]|uniref:P-loop containing nucleoside triphosphate hydrolase protein n=1 Tax=Zopfia rhizophila CBS 207.26 TaxID=1314779 RepID=A0A6A6DIH0_9PEZI|nr:P-loop containing nucleoside triphosphate hydrolase protein [Zopfia rhizophila CBS 207.26]
MANGAIPDGVEPDPLDHLPENERAILKRQLDILDISVNYATLYRYATSMDLAIIMVASICSIGAGAALPLIAVIIGQFTGAFQGIFQGTLSQEAFNDQLVHYTLYFVYLAVSEFGTTYIGMLGFIYTGEHISGKIREHYLAAILRQNIGFFDKLGAGEITTRITADSNLVQDGMSQKVSLTMVSVATFITAFIISFVRHWKLTLILCSTIVAIVLSMGGGARFIMKYKKLSLDSYAIGGSVAEEVISSIRNATAFNTQKKLARQYDTHLVEAAKWGLKMKIVLAFMFGSMMTIVYLNYSLAFWMGSRYLVSGDMSLADIITVLMAVLLGAISLGSIGPWIQSFTTATAAAMKIFNTIDRTSPLDPTVNSGDKLETFQGTIELRKVKHIYPSRPKVVVIEEISLIVPAGKTTAIVGASGSGKSTIIGLIERFYDPVGGEVLLDGHNIQDLNLRWFRQHVSLVQQEPVLFTTSIYNNIRHGLIGARLEALTEEKMKEMIYNAARISNAHDFVSALPEGYETNVGEHGFLLSGGQKQRIAIARAIVSNPKILLLDEATSALDTKSEGVVQAALEKAAEGRTTIVIAHRLSTIKTADNIVVMSQGKIVEQGTHDELLVKSAAYYHLVEAQCIAAGQENKNADETHLLYEQNDQPFGGPTRGRSNFLENPDSSDIIPFGKLSRTQAATSESSIACQKKRAQKAQEYSLWTLIRLVASFNKKEWHLMLIGLFWSIIAGAGYSVQSVFFAKSIAALSLPPPFYGKVRSEANFWSSMYLMLAMTQMISFTGQGLAFACCSERLVRRTRDQAFRTMLRQDIAFFDREENAAGVLTSFLSTQTTNLAGLSGVTLGTILFTSTILITAITLSIAIGWKLTLVCTATVPVLVAAGFYRFWMLASYERRAKKAYEGSAGYACEATSAIKTVASLAREDDVYQEYHRQIVDQNGKSLRSVVKSTLLYAMSQSFTMLASALGFWYGGQLIARHEYSMFQFFICFTAVIFGAQSAGTIFSFAPDMGKAKEAAAELKRLFDRKPDIDSWSEEGQKLERMEGAIEFRDVHFRYPTRPEQPVLRGLSLTVKPGQYVALVGASGCGKSTTIALLERFYDPLVGGVFVDGIEISSLNINNYRSYLALVSQEPTLYQGTIRENVLLGVDRDDVTEEEIIKACNDANIYDFIMSLPDGFATFCGSKGTLLSGGQKQRIAIARALIRQPQILLLDEATSALDSKSEKVVQAALDAAAKGRTTVAVAHRLSTIQKADVIYVFDCGKVVENGTHAELMKGKGKYFELVILQSLERTVG